MPTRARRRPRDTDSDAPPPIQLCALERLPCELLQDVLFRAAWEVGEPLADLTSVDLVGDGHSTRRFASAFLPGAARVSRRMHEVARPLVFRHVEVTSLKRLKRLARVLKARPADASEVLSLRFEYLDVDRETEASVRQDYGGADWAEFVLGDEYEHWVWEENCSLLDEFEDTRWTVFGRCSRLIRLELDVLLGSRTHEHIPSTCSTLVVDTAAWGALVRALDAAGSIVNLAFCHEVDDVRGPLSIGAAPMARLLQLGVYAPLSVAFSDDDADSVVGVGSRLTRLTLHWCQLEDAVIGQLVNFTSLRVLELHVPNETQSGLTRRLDNLFAILPPGVSQLAFVADSPAVARPTFLNESPYTRSRPMLSIAFVAGVASVLGAVLQTRRPRRLVMRGTLGRDGGMEADRDAAIARLREACDGASIELVCPRPLDQGDQAVPDDA